jgi:NAD+ diphosphatase
MSISSDTSLARPFSGMALDRAMPDRADDARIARLLTDPATRMLLASRDGVLMTDDAEPSLVRSELLAEAQRAPILLGLEDGVALFAVDFDALAPALQEVLTAQARIVQVRDAGTLLSRPEAGLAAYLAALMNWHRTHPFCACCGAATVVAEGGYSRRCPRCEANHFPRTDPVVIMTVEHQGRLLLGRQAAWPAGRYSVLAGFVSPGESAQEAVMREVREESGIIAYNPTFVTSQPWPFPSSLMLGFHARAHGGEPTARDGELAEVGWFTREQVRNGLRGVGPDLLLPTNVSIAWFLINRWAWLDGRDGHEPG